MGPILFAPGGKPPGVIYILHFILYLYLFYHQSSIITHHSSIISHQSSLINHQLSIINHPWSMINHQSSITSHHFVVKQKWNSELLSWHAFFLGTRWSFFSEKKWPTSAENKEFSILGDQFFLNMQRRGNRLGTFGHHRRPSRRIEKRREASVNPWELLGTVGNLHFE